MICIICKQEFTDSEYEDHLFKIKSKILCGKCHSGNIHSTIYNAILHSTCKDCGSEVI